MLKNRSKNTKSQFTGVSESHTPNPSMVFLSFLLDPLNPQNPGHVDLTTFPNFTFVSFTHTYVGKGMSGDSWSLQLYDPTWTDIEFYLFQKEISQTYVLFRYGYTDEGSAKSPPRYGVVSGVTCNLETSGMTITITGGSSNIITQFTQRFENFSDASISDIIKKMISFEGLREGLIVPTKKIPHPNNDSQHFTFQMHGQTFMQFINSYLIPHSISESGEANYKLHISSATEPPTVHYYPENYDTSDYFKTEDKAYKTYLYQRSEKSEVISWAPSIIPINIYSKKSIHEAGGILSSTQINKKTGLVENIKTDPKDLKDNKNPATKKDPKKFQTETLKQKVKPNPLASPKDRAARNPGRNFILPSSSVQTVQVRQRCALACADSSGITGNLTLVGDPHFPSGELSRVRLIVLTPLNQEHYSSGLYQVTQVTHTISSSYTTSVELKSPVFQSSDQKPSQSPIPLPRPTVITPPKTTV